MAHIYPSLIAADQLNLAATIKELDPHVIGYHLDIMDNHFVPNLTWGSLVVNAIPHLTIRQLWVHLMVDNPQDWVNILNLPADSIFSFHFEAIGNDIHLIKHIKEKKWKVSVAIKPSTNIDKIFPLLNHIDQVLIMSVEPGFSGQPFISSVTEKIDPLIGYRQTSGLNFSIAMDGGINKNNIKGLTEKGVDDFAIGSAIFGQPDPVAALEELKKLVK
jgi:ribulose-phosphate 3-epimerase